MTIPGSSSRWRKTQPIIGWVFFALLGLGWWLTLAPTNLGGPATFVLVAGHSMQPKLHTGDLAVATKQAGYEVGDLIVLELGGGRIIHRLHQRAADGTWITKGDNNTYVDPLTTKTNDILGKYRFFIPQAGAALGWVRQNPLLFAALTAPLGLVPYLPKRRRIFTDELKVALAFGSKEPRRDGRKNSEYGYFFASLAVTTFTGLVSLLNYELGRIFLPLSLVSLLGFCLSLFVTWLLTARLYDGYGVSEPSASMYALTGRLYLVQAFPANAQLAAVRVKSAKELRNLAEELRLPILHRVDNQTGLHEFLLLTAKHGSFIWAPPRRSRGFGNWLLNGSAKKTA